MGWQPIQLPQNFNPLGNVADALTEARQAQQAEDARRAEFLLRQRQQEGVEQERARTAYTQNQDRQAQIRMQITQALDAGRPDMARQIASAYGVPLPERQVQQQAPGDELMKPSTPVQQEPVQGPLPSAEDMARATRTRVAGDERDDGSNLAAQLASAEEGRQGFERDQQGMRFDPQGLMARKPDKTLYNVGGLEYDPTEVRRAEQERIARNVEQQRAAFSGFGDKYGNLAAGLAAGADPKLSPVIAAAMEKDAAREAAATEKSTNRTFLEGEHKLNRQQSDINNRRIAAAMAARHSADLPQKEARSNLDAAKYFSDEYGKFQKEAGIPQDAKEFRLLSDGLSLSKKDNSLSQRKGQFNLGRSINGPGVFTDADRRAILSNVAGALGMAETAVEKMIDGQMGERERAVVEQAARNQLEVVKLRIQLYDEGARQRFGPDSEFADVQNLFVNRHRANMQQYGLGKDLPSQGGSELLIGSKQAMDKRNSARAEKMKNAGKDAMDRALELLR